VELEKRGIPTAVICSDAFISLARAISRAKGIPAPRLVVIPHPLAGITPTEVQKKADDAMNAIVAILADSAPSSEDIDGDKNDRL
jgi:hypothetical protein